MLDIMGFGTSFHWGDLRIADAFSGVVILFVGPFLFSVVGFTGPPFTHPLFLWALRTCSGLSLTGDWLEPDKHQVWKKDHSND